MKITSYDEPTPEKERKPKLKKFRDPERQKRKKRNYDRNKQLRAEWNRAVASGQTSRVEEPPYGLNKLGSGNKVTTGHKSHTPHRRLGQNHEPRP